MPMPIVADATKEPITERRAARIMWDFYRDNKSQLAPHVRNYRELIIAQLIQGQSAKQAFSQFIQASVPRTLKSRTG
jgi:hypothetical protein